MYTAVSRIGCDTLRHSAASGTPSKLRLFLQCSTLSTSTENFKHSQPDLQGRTHDLASHTSFPLSQVTFEVGTNSLWDPREHSCLLKDTTVPAQKQRLFGENLRTNSSKVSIVYVAHFVKTSRFCMTFRVQCATVFSLSLAHTHPLSLSMNEHRKTRHKTQNSSKLDKCLNKLDVTNYKEVPSQFP